MNELNLQLFKKQFGQMKSVRFIEESVGDQSVTICCYMVADEALWNMPNGLETRGITFDSSGNVISRPFPKFFNLNERPETQERVVRRLYESLPASQKQLLVKRDGSMISALLLDNKVVLKSKKSLYSDVLVSAANVAIGNEPLINAILVCLLAGYTPIFEFTSPDNRIVIDYGNKPELTLLAIRNNNDGSFLLDQSDCYWRMFEGRCRIIESLPISASWDELMNMVETVQGQEGWVLNLNGLRIKLKTKWYLERHRMIDVRERDVADLVIADQLDDLMQTMRSQNADLKVVMDIQSRVARELGGINERAELLHKAILDLPSRKDMVYYIKEHDSDVLGPVMALIDRNQDKYTMLIKKLWANKFRDDYSLRSITNSNF